jgi:hypothetical protein
MRKSKISIVKLLITGIAIFILDSNIVSAQVSVILPTLTIQQGSATEWINVTVGNLTGQNVSAFQFTLSYNKSVIYIDSAVSGPVSSGGSFVFNADTADQQIKVAFASANALSDSGTLVQLKVHFVNSGSSPLSFNGTFEFNAGTPAASVTEGSIIVTTVSLPAWQQTNGPFPYEEILALAVNSLDYVFAGTNGNGAYLSTDNGTSWSQLYNGLTNSHIRSLAINSKGYIFAGTDGGVNLSTDDGANWSAVNSGLTDTLVQALVINSSGYIFAGTSSSGVFLSTNNGTSWKQVSNGLTTSNVHSLAANSSGYIFAGTVGGGVFLSTDNGTNWVQVNNGITNNTIWSLAVNSSGNIFAGTYGGGIFLSTNNGISWTAQNNGLPSGPDVYSLAINSSGYIFAGMGYLNLGVYISTNNSTSWTLSGLPNNNVAALAVNSSGYVFAGTYEAGVYRTSSTTTAQNVVTNSASNITSTTAELNGIVNPNGISSAVYFDYGTSTSYGTTVTAAQSLVTGTSNVNVSAALTGLTPNTLYHFRCWATNSTGTTYGADSTFVTLSSGSAWTTKAGMQLARSQSAAEVINGILYVAGGSNGSSDDPSLQAYTIATNSWAVLASMPGGRYQGDGAGVINGKLYITGGWTSSPGLPNNNLWVYNPSTNAWSTLASTPTLTGTGASGVINGKLYVTTSCDGYSGYQNFLWVYDTSANSWTNLAGSPAPHGGAAYGVINGKFYLAGGVNGAGTTFNELDVYDPSSNTWATLAPMPVARSFAFSGVINGKLYVAGGSDGSSIVSTVEVYDPAANTWSTGTSMLAPRQNGASAVYNGTLYAVGGLNSSGSLVATVEAYTPGGVTSLPSAPVLSGPANSSTGVSTSPALSWNVSSGAVSYRLQVSTDSTFAATTYDTSGITATSKVISGLSFQVKYFWRVNVTNSAGTSGWSDIWSFTTTSGSPKISSFSPTSGPIGTMVTINGANFSSIVADNIVFFGAVKATVEAASLTSLSVVVPLGTTFQPISVTVNGFTTYSSAPFIVTFPSSRIINTTSFDDSIHFKTGSFPHGIAAFDIDGDGKVDLVVLNSNDNNISVFRNTSSPGSISFADTLDFQTGSGPDFVAAGDFDGSGKQDIVVTNYNSSTVSVFRNTSSPGTISFADSIDLPAGIGASGVVIGDIDGDGKPDIIVGNSGNYIFSVYRNVSTAGKISFADSVNFRTGTDPTEIAICDVDGDGKPDIVATNFYDNTFSVYRNTSIPGNISFAPAVTFHTGSGPWGIGIGDVDGDGKPDVIVPNYNTASVSIFRNTSSPGSISFANSVDFNTESQPQSVALCDLDGDGKPDLVVVDNASASVSVLKNTSIPGTVSFASKVDFSTGVHPTNGIAIADIDGDGKPEVLVTNSDANNVSVLRNTISGSLPAPVLLSPSNGSIGVSTNLTLTWNASIFTNSTLFKFLKKAVLKKAEKLMKINQAGLSYRIQLSSDSTFVSGIFADITTADTSYNVTGLSNSTPYYWRVDATDSVGTSLWSIVWNFITISNPAVIITGSASNITQTTATLNGTVNPNGLSSTVQFVFGATTNYGDTVAAAQSIVTGSSILNVSANISSLTPNTIYHFKCRVVNSNGVISGVDSTFTTLNLQSKPSVTTLSATNISSTSSTLNGTVNPNGLSSTVKFDYGTTTSYGSTVPVSSVTGSTATSVSANISNLTPYTLYHYRVEASNSGGTSVGADMKFTTNFSYPSSFSLSQSYTFGDPTQSSSYQLIGLPGNLNASLTQFISGTAKQDWDAYYDNGNTSNYLSEYDGSSTFTFEPGNGFWIISKNEISISKTVGTVPLTDTSYSILMHNGWNIISNPFQNSVDWDSVISANSLSSNSIIYSWNGTGWPTPSTFAPYEGYYFYNQQNLQYLKIPYNPGVIGKSLSKAAAFNEYDTTASLRLSAEEGGKEKSYVIISIDSTSSNDYDNHDILAPPGDFEDVGMALYNEKLSIAYKNLLKESRPMTGNGQAFVININDKLKEPLTLKSEGVNNFKNSEVYLVDINNAKLYNLKENNSIIINPALRSEYQVLIGNADFIKTEQAELLPADYKLFQNYPNPFNPVTTIEYSVPKTSYVTLKVYDILGKEVAVLVNGPQTAGYYRVQFPSKGSYASGVYFCRMKAGSFVQTKKLLLLK